MCLYVVFPPHQCKRGKASLFFEFVIELNAMLKMSLVYLDHFSVLRQAERKSSLRGNSIN